METPPGMADITVLAAPLTGGITLRREPMRAALRSTLRTEARKLPRPITRGPAPMALPIKVRTRTPTGEALRSRRTDRPLTPSIIRTLRGRWERCRPPTADGRLPAAPLTETASRARPPAATNMPRITEMPTRTPAAAGRASTNRLGRVLPMRMPRGDGDKKRAGPPRRSREREAGAGDRGPIALAAGKAAVVEAAGVEAASTVAAASAAAAVGDASHKLTWASGRLSRNHSQVGVGR